MKAVIVEDEINARNVLIYLLKELFPEIEIVGEAATFSKAKKIILDKKPDLVFLDVQLEDGTGIELLQQLKIIDFQIIFTTAYAEFAINAIKFGALDYLLKPIDPDELKKAVLKVNKQIEKYNTEHLFTESYDKNNRKTILINTSEKTFLIPINDIIRLEADGSYTTITTTNDKIFTSKNLKYYEKELPQEAFIRTHQSHLVNKKFIHAINKDGFLQLTNQELIPISFRKKSLVKNSLKN